MLASPKHIVHNEGSSVACIRLASRQAVMSTITWIDHLLRTVIPLRGCIRYSRPFCSSPADMEAL